MSSPLTVDVLRKITMDYAMGKEPLDYTPSMLEARERLRVEFEAFKAKNPKAWIDVGDD